MQGGKEKFLAIERSTSKLWQSDGSTTKGLPDSRNNGTSVALTNGTISVTSLRTGAYASLGSVLNMRRKVDFSARTFATRISASATTNYDR